MSLRRYNFYSTVRLNELTTAITKDKRPSWLIIDVRLWHHSLTRKVLSQTKLLKKEKNKKKRKIEQSSDNKWEITRSKEKNEKQGKNVTNELKGQKIIDNDLCQINHLEYDGSIDP